MIVVLDGLRGDLIGSGVTPNLDAFLSTATHFRKARAVFPTSTRVNAAALSTGAMPAQTGLMSNRLLAPEIEPARPLNTGDPEDLRRIEAARGGRLLDTETLAERAARAGRRVAVVSSASGGTTRLLHPRAAAFGHVRLTLRDWKETAPAGLAAELEERFGSVPAAARPNTGRLRRQTDIWLDAVAATEPHLAILWYGEPDWTLHQDGLAGPRSRAAIRAVDAELGRLLDWQADRDRDERWTVIVASDHGHVAVSEKVDARENLRGAGFPTGFGGILSSFGRYGALALPAERRDLLAPLAEFLAAAPWVAAAFARDAAGPLPGTLPMSLIGCDGPRAPDLMIALHGIRDAWTAGGLSGQGLMDSDTVPVGGSAHGGLLPEELATVLAASGPGFDRGRTSDAPAGVTDIAATAAALLGLARPASERGLLGDLRPHSVQVENHAVPGRPGRRLRMRRYGAQVYVDGIYEAGEE